MVRSSGDFGWGPIWCGRRATPLQCTFYGEREISREYTGMKSTELTSLKGGMLSRPM
jgi:hypothetical protein